MEPQIVTIPVASFIKIIPAKVFNAFISWLNMNIKSNISI